ncbi:MAG: hypothetical protein U9R17_11355 [Thermodesulfobacteriota bacterium]|nr:hypothetical protein [Thermodesulfobacteriota bacterium]
MPIVTIAAPKNTRGGSLGLWGQGVCMLDIVGFAGVVWRNYKLAGVLN